MTAPRNPDRLIRTYLIEDQATGHPEVPDRVYSAMRDRIEQTRQRAVIGSMGVPDMNKFLAIGLGAAAVVALLLIGSNLFGSGSPPPGGAPSPSEPEPSTEVSSQAGSAAGAYVVFADAPGVGSITVTVPNGWDVYADGHYLAATEFENTGVLFYAADVYVYGNPCSWSTTRPDAPATTVDEVIAALMAQEDRNATAPTDFEWVGDDGQGRSGRMTSFSVPHDAVFADCDQESYGVLTEPAADGPTRTNQEPGQIDEFWVLDVDGVPVTFDITYFPETPQGVIEEMRAIAESATFEMP